MGNQSSKEASYLTCNLVDELCHLVQQQYSAPYCLTLNHFGLEHYRGQPSITSDFAISSMVDEAEDTQPLANPNATVGDPSAFISSPSKTYTQLRSLQKNQSQSKLTKKAKKISKPSKLNLRRLQPTLNPEEGDCNSNETVADDLMRDQNNCKSYHKLVKNYLIQGGMSEEIDKYETKYHTRYYFIVCLIMIKHHLNQDFRNIYQQIVEKELAIQQRKIDRKLNQLRLTQEKLTLSLSKGQETHVLRAKQGSLQSQIEHIKVVKFEIENYSVRSCRAFFQGEIEESLKILYLKNDPVMRKKYYFDQALLVVKELQSQMRKSRSHR